MELLLDYGYGVMNLISIMIKVLRCLNLLDNMKHGIFSVMEIWVVDGFNNDKNLLSTKYNITTNFGSNTCDIAGGYYNKGV